ncbi:disease resistance protein RPV1 [Eucalyptus grandis]|uniref:disease resistance protein RPV1 n=1 Tax=Eucalyptus grandis TaxID=71139 RepID=UPI00192EB4F4|nr:disease resistance protein RPV1 [Eucalyptus grandis]
MEERKMKRVSSWPLSNFDQNNKEITHRKADDNAAPSSSATPKGSNIYDVFLSFRGMDTRKTFVDHLYNGLVDAGIYVFRDDDELHEGEKIDNNLLQAIKNSKISIPVLSQNYASSKWCLKELVQMTECMKNNGQVVLPIFYRVEPTDVQHQEGSFGEAFFRSSGKYSEEEVAEWKQALHEVGSIKGWESEKTANGYFIFYRNLILFLLTGSCL